MDVSIEVEDIKKQLENIQEFIHYADRLTGYYRGIQVIHRTNVISEASFLMEDILDEYTKICAQQEDRIPGCVPSLFEFVDLIKNMILRRQIKRMYEDLNSQFREMEVEISKNDALPIQSTSEQGWRYGENQQNANLKTPYMDKTNVLVGLDDQIDKLIGWLVTGRSECTGIFVIGMGGIGKTTLAKEVFHNKHIIRDFDCRVWVPVLESSTLDDLLRNMLNQFYKQSGEFAPEAVYEMGRVSLIDEVTNYLRQKRYVLFFDDVWDEKFWADIAQALPEDRNGSRVFITTRRMNVTRNSEMFKVHEMELLTPEKSMELFFIKAFQSNYKGNHPTDLQNISYEFVSKFKGLPLSIVSIGSLLSRKPKTVSEWKRISHNLNLEIEKNPVFEGVKEMFSLNYGELPFHLKQCLLYFAIYPQYCGVKSKRLIRQWIAEGFVKHESEMTLEEIAEEYLTELVHRKLVQVSSYSLDGKVKFCCVHNIIRQIILTKGRYLRFCKFIGDDDQYLPGGIIRRLSIATTSNVILQSIESSHVQSLLFFTEEEIPDNLVKGIPTKYKLLKVLDFENARSLDVPENVGDLIHLKYLSFRNTNLQSLPKSIGKLLNLETLDLRQTNVNEIPKEINKFSKLRHLLGNTMSMSQLKGGLGGMESLQTLSEVRIDEDGLELITELGKLTQLRKLSLSDVREEHGIALCSSINEMPHLEKLYIETKYKDEHIDLSFVSDPAMLQKLRLQAKLNKLPEWIPKLENLVELTMSYSHITEDPLEQLQKLPDLLVLNLTVHSYEGDCLHFQEGGFKKLKEISLRYLYNLESIIIEEGALPSLKELTFMNIPNLKTAPSGIDFLENLELLKTFMPTEFVKSIAPFAKRVKIKNFWK